MENSVTRVTCQTGPTSLMQPLLVFPDPAPPELAQALDLGGRSWTSVPNAAAAERSEPDGGWGGAIVVADREPEGAFALCRALRKNAGAVVRPLVILVNGGQIGELEMRNDLFDDFCLWPFQPREFDARLKHAFWKAGAETGRIDIIEYEGLLLNVDTYQASIGGEALELTYMEYELLKFLASHPGKVFTRETLLSRVWGYDYFGGARTVDVHVRRLRSKLGEDNAAMIATVRSVGYSFGKATFSL